MGKKITLTLLILSVVLVTIQNTQAVAQQSKLNSKIILTAPTDAAAKANKGNSSIGSPFSEIMNDPIINSAVNGFGNAMQGMTGGTYDMQEKMKQQVDYAKQQENYADADD